MNRPLILLLLFAALSAPARAGEPETVRFGVCLSLSGEFQASGRKALAGVRLRMEEHNARAAEAGFRLDMVVRDDRSDPAAAAAAVRELAGGEGLPAIIGPLSTNLMLEAREAAVECGAVMISPSVTSPRVGRNRDWAFRILFDDAFQGVALARFLREKAGMRRAAAIFNERLGYAGSVHGSFKENFERLGGELVASERYNWVASEDEDFDFEPVLRKVAAADPEIILLPVNSVEIAAIVRASTLAGIPSRFCGGDTWQHENVLLSGGNNLAGAYFVSGVDFGSGTPAMRRFLDLYDHSNDPDIQPISVLGYDALSLLVEALGKGRDGASIREALYDIRDFELATGSITIDPELGSVKTAYIHRIGKEDDLFKAEIVYALEP